MKKPGTVAIIQARMGSSRLPGKALLNETGKFLIQHVYEQACQTKANDVLVATDDERIFRAVQSDYARLRAVLSQKSELKDGND